MKKSKKQIVIVFLVVLLVIGAVLFFLLRPKDAPKEQEVIDLLQQAAEIYHPNHSSLPSVQELVAVGSKDNPAEHGYYDEVSDYDSVVCAVFSENGIRELENSYLPEGPIILKKDGKVYHISNQFSSMSNQYFAEIVSLQLLSQDGDTFTYQAEAKYGYREEDAGMDAPLSLSEPETYTFTVVRQDDKLLMEQFTYPGVSEENRCNTEDWIIS